MALNRAKVLQTAEKYVKQGKLEAAIQQYQLIIGENPKDINIRNKVGDLYARAGSVPEAVREFKYIAESYTDEGFILKAIAIYKKIIKLDPAQADLLRQLADLYARQGLVPDAKACFLNLLDRYLQEGKLQKAIETIQSLLQIEPDNMKVRAKLADLYLKDGKLNDAMAEYNAVGTELLKKNKHEEALKVFDRALTLAPDNSTILASLARLYVEKKNADVAIQKLESALNRKPKDPELLRCLADIYSEARMHEKAIDAYEQVQKITPDDPILQSKVEGLRKLMQSAETATSTRHVVQQTDLTGAIPIDDLGDLSGEWAEEEIRKTAEPKGAAVSAPPAAPGSFGASVRDRQDFISGHMTDVEVFIKYGLIDKAIEQIEGVLKKYPDSLEVLQKFRAVLIEKGDKKRAAEACVAIAGLYRDAGNMPEAFKFLNEAREMDPDVHIAAAPPHAAEAAPEFGVEAPEAAASSGGGVREQEISLEFDAEASAAPGGAQEEPAEAGRAAGQEDGFFFDFDTGGKDGAGAAGLEGAGGPQIEFGDAGEEEGAGAGSAGLSGDGGLGNIDVEVEETHPISTDGLDLDGLAPDFGDIETEIRGERVEESDEAIEISLDDEGTGEKGEGPVTFLDEAIRPGRIPSAAPGEPVAVENESPLAGEGGDEDLFAQEKDFFDLASTLESELAESDRLEEGDLAASAGEGEGEGAQSGGLQDIVRDIKTGIEEKLGDEDYEMHYNLGIAYKEMDLLEDAITEFQLAAKDPNRFADCCNWLGICFREKGMAKLAAKWYQKGVDAAGTNTDQLLGLLYGLGEAYEEAGDLENSLDTFTDVYGLNSEYREIAAKIKNLEEKLGQ